ncbi:hypothetical protein DMENIID0001_165900 [Sergentomyia squamirostris]
MDQKSNLRRISLDFPVNFIAENFTKICHLCLNIGENLTDKLSHDDGDIFCGELYKYLVGSDDFSAEDNLPEKICEECAKNLQAACDFKRRSSEVVEYLRSRNSRQKILVKFEEVSLKSEPDDEEEGIDVLPDYTHPESDGEESFTSEDDVKDATVIPSVPEIPQKPPKLVQKNSPGFTCAECMKTLSSKEGLKLHLKRHFLGHPFKCHLCPEAFMHFNGRKRHISLVHFNRKMLECPFCEASFQHYDTFRKHIQKIHDRDRDIICPECPKTFYTDAQLEIHRKIHDFIPKCTICGTLSKNLDALKAHMRILHKVYRYQPPELTMKMEERPEKAPAVKKTFHCEKCKKNFKSQLMLDKHLKTIHREWLCTDCGQVIKKMSQAAHMKHHHNPKSQECPTCGKVLKNIATLKRHVKFVHGPKIVRNFNCPHCDMKFISSQTKKYHVAREHTKKPLYTCHCGEGFLYHHVYKRHVRRDHTGEYPHSCDICSKKFLSLAECRRHKLTHSSDRTFLCRICGKDFKTDIAVYSHMRSHHRKGEQV